MSLEDKVLQVLNGPTVARIRFRFPIAGGHIIITPQTFHRVARAIRSGAVIVRRPTDLDPTAGAQYNDVARTRQDGTVVRANTLELNAVTGRFDEATIVHESLHAAYDLQRTAGLDANSEEASAITCPALCCRLPFLPLPLFPVLLLFSPSSLFSPPLLLPSLAA